MQETPVSLDTGYGVPQVIFLLQLYFSNFTDIELELDFDIFIHPFLNSQGISWRAEDSKKI